MEGFINAFNVGVKAAIAALAKNGSPAPEFIKDQPTTLLTSGAGGENHIPIALMQPCITNWLGVAIILRWRNLHLIPRKQHSDVTNSHSRTRDIGTIEAVPHQGRS